MGYSGSGEVTAPVHAVDFVVPAGQPDISTSGCEAADFAGFTPGSIALVQRGTCLFRIKVANAQAAGAVGVIVANDGLPGRTGATGGTLSAPQMSLPAVFVSSPMRETLAGTVLDGPTGVTVRLAVSYLVESRTGRNVIAETSGGDPARVVVVGAALDGGETGPGVNRATGAATTLEIAEVFASQQRSTTSRLRFIWFGGQVSRLGATSYVDALSTEDRGRIKAMLDIQELGSPNYGRFVYDGNNSDFALPLAPGGSGTLEALLTDYFGRVSLSMVPSSTQPLADKQPFLEAGIPVGGVFGGTVGVKTAAEAALFGGTAGVAYDPCSGAACDGSANLNLTALDQLSDAGAHIVLLLSKRNLARNPL
jgi:Zn-dependent M28 family amino/carboxypeptidase